MAQFCFEECSDLVEKTADALAGSIDTRSFQLDTDLLSLTA